ncbi:MAG: hypothetical protein Q4P66_00165 [Actinomycetaceae bacterium]|nr:hypothetical protein [Actinomycetaceae bacterium]
MAGSHAGVPVDDEEEYEYTIPDFETGLAADVIRLILPSVPYGERRGLLYDYHCPGNSIEHAMFNCLSWAHDEGLAIDARWFDRIEEEFPPDDPEWDYSYSWIVPYVTK